jgi:hypothetical protein
MNFLTNCCRKCSRKNSHFYIKLEEKCIHRGKMYPQEFLETQRRDMARGRIT